MKSQWNGNGVRGFDQDWSAISIQVLGVALQALSSHIIPISSAHLIAVTVAAVTVTMA